MAKYRYIYCDFWNDEKIELELTPEDRYIFLYLLTNDRTNILGIYPITFKRISYQTGYTPESIKAIIGRLESFGLIKYNFENFEICIVNWGKWNLIKGGKPVEDAIKSELKNVKTKEFIQILKKSIESEQLVNNCFSDDTSTIRPRYVDKTETETETETKIETETKREKKEPDEPAFTSMLSVSKSIFSKAGIEGVFFEKMKMIHCVSDDQINDAFFAWKQKNEAIGTIFKTEKHLKASFNKFLEYQKVEAKPKKTNKSVEELVEEMEREGRI